MAAPRVLLFICRLWSVMWRREQVGPQPVGRGRDPTGHGVGIVHHQGALLIHFLNPCRLSLPGGPQSPPIDQNTFLRSPLRLHLFSSPHQQQTGNCTPPTYTVRGRVSYTHVHTTAQSADPDHEPRRVVGINTRTLPPLFSRAEPVDVDHSRIAICMWTGPGAAAPALFPSADVTGIRDARGSCVHNTELCRGSTHTHTHTRTRHTHTHVWV